MGTPSYLLSFLAIQAARLQAKFGQKYGGGWLVWEPGSWQPPNRALVQTMGVTKERATSATAPTDTDALCFSLGESPLVKVGRALDNDCVVSDATVSRNHLELRHSPAGWQVNAVGGRLVELNGRRLTSEKALVAFDQLRLGNVTLTFFPTHEALLTRLQS